MKDITVREYDAVPIDHMPGANSHWPYSSFVYLARSP